MLRAAAPALLWESIMRCPAPLLTAAKCLLESPCVIGLSLKYPGKSVTHDLGKDWQFRCPWKGLGVNLLWFCRAWKIS